MPGDQWQAKLDTYLDGELPPEEAKALDAHLRACPSCTAEMSSRVQLRRVVKNVGNRYTLSSDFRRRMTTIAVPQKSSRRGWWWIAAAAAAVIVVAGVIGYSSSRGLSREQIYSELADQHVATLASNTPVDVVSTDRHTVKPWFQGKIPFTFNLPELPADSEFSLIGGRVSYLHQTPGAHLIYEVRKHQISVFIFQDRAILEMLTSEGHVGRKLSFNVESWNHDGLRFFVMGDASAEDIHKLGRLLRNADAS
ncbi:MAG TPA: zf-HC2 domain-containing protein [Terriglobales bacterium]|nr:zf-HC2 domain-containing protein [Terriglobales bacterium]